MRVNRYRAGIALGALNGQHTATRRKSWTGQSRKPKNDSGKKFLRAKAQERGFESIESRGAKTLPASRLLCFADAGDETPSRAVEPRRPDLADDLA